MRLIRVLAAIVVALVIAYAAREPQADGRMKGAFRKPAENGWTYVHLEGSPPEIGFSTDTAGDGDPGRRKVLR